MEFYPEAISWIIEKKPDKIELSKYKKNLCKKYKIVDIPTDINIYLHATKDDARIIRPFLQTKPTRTGSGVAVIATMTRPINCPHGSCIYCPGGIASAFGDVPKSYTGKEPSTMRGIRNDYDPYRIIFNRLEQYIALGQNPEKVDQIVMGGTFTSFPKKYQHDYIYYSFKAYNDFSRLFYEDGEFDIVKYKEFFELPGDIADDGRAERIREKVLALKNQNVKTLEEEQKDNESAAIRCIGLTIETKPEQAFADKGLELLQLGTTRVEIGVQTVYDDILKFVNRGHTIEDTKKAIAELRDLGFKLNFHMMPGLPRPDGTRISQADDIASLKKIFDEPAFRPDMLKIYPCMVMPGTPLKRYYDDGIFKPLDTEGAAEIISESFRFIPEYCRVMRIQRDIPTYATTAGVGRTNLRQYVDELMKKKGIVARDIRAREVKDAKLKSEPALVVREYDASNGREFFISMEADDKILGFVRLRLPPRSLHPVITLNSALIRELHVYGPAIAIGKSSEHSQHRGVGRSLMQKAEEIAKSNSRDKMVVISGVGVREYYRKLGYSLEGPYMCKRI